jgi:hypothetical protein
MFRSSSARKHDYRRIKTPRNRELRTTVVLRNLPAAAARKGETTKNFPMLKRCQPLPRVHNTSVYEMLVSDISRILI